MPFAVNVTDRLVASGAGDDASIHGVVRLRVVTRKEAPEKKKEKETHQQGRCSNSNAK